MPPLKVRLSDRDGGVYGPGASVASTGSNRHQHSPQHPATVQEWNDVLEFYRQLSSLVYIRIFLVS